MNRNNWRLPLCIAISSVFITPAYAELTILPGETYLNTVALENIDLILNQGTFENSATVNNLDLSIFNNQGSTLNNGDMFFQYQSALLNYGSFENLGSLFFSNAARLDNYASFLNSGIVETSTLTNQASAVFTNTVTGVITMNADSSINNAGVFNHYGNITSGAPSAPFINILNNSGIFNNNGSFTLPYNEFRLNNSGTFNNNADLASVATLDNSGTFQNTGSVQGANSLLNSGLFENSAFVNVLSQFVNGAAGVFNNGPSGFVSVMGVLENRGEFNNQFELSLYENSGVSDPFTGRPLAVELNNSGIFNNSGNIWAYGSEGLNLTNLGTFNNNGNLNAGQRTVITNSGVFNSNTSLDFTTGDVRGSEIINLGTFNNNADLASVATLDNSGTFQNNRSIQGVNSLLNSGLFENSAFVNVLSQFVNSVTGVFNNGSELYGVNIDVSGVLQNQGEFNNNANIQLTDGVDVNTGMPTAAELNNSGVFNNTGNITTSSYGIVINNSGEFNHTGQIVLPINSTINNYGTFNNGEIFNFAQSPFLLSGNTQLNNSGTFNNYRTLDGGSSAKLINRGVLNNNSSIINFGPFINEGTINNQNVLYPTQIVVNNALDNRGTLNNGEMSRIELGYNFSGGSTKILNTGSIINNGEIIGTGDINNQGTITNNASIQGAINIVSSGLITNAGSIIADSIEISGRLEGTGDINVVGINGLVITEAGTLAPAYINNPNNPFAVSSGLTMNGMLVLDGTLEITFNDLGLFEPMTVSGPVQLGANSVLDVTLQDYNWGLGSSYDLMFANSIVGDFGAFFYGTSIDPLLALEWSIFNDGFRDVLRVDVVSAVPLPASVWLFLSGIVGLISIRRRRH